MRRFQEFVVKSFVNIHPAEVFIFESPLFKVIRLLLSFSWWRVVSLSSIRERFFPFICLHCFDAFPHFLVLKVPWMKQKKNKYCFKLFVVVVVSYVNFFPELRTQITVILQTSKDHPYLFVLVITSIYIHIL